MSKFETLIRRADTLRRLETDPIAQAWWAGYLRGLRRAYHENFGADEEHTVWLGLVNSDDVSQAAAGRGYAAGLTLESRDPDPAGKNTISDAGSPMQPGLISISGRK